MSIHFMHKLRKTNSKKYIVQLSIGTGPLETKKKTFWYHQKREGQNSNELHLHQGNDLILLGEAKVENSIFTKRTTSYQ